MKQSYISYIFIFLILLVSNCAKNPVTGNQNLVLMTEEQEKQMGKQSDQQISATMGIYDDPELQSYIETMGKNMVKIAHRPDLGYSFKIIDSPVPNAFAVPGGYIYFTRGIMAHFNNEAELAGVLGHEIGHISARHSAQQYANNVLVQTGLQLGAALSPEFRQYAQYAQMGTSLLFLKFSRDAERQSDKLGVDYSTAVGYDAREMASFFTTLERLSGQQGRAIPNFLSTHPDPGERASRVERMARKQMKEDQSYKIDRNDYLAKIDGMVYGEDPRNGFTDLGHFYHPELAFQFPYPSGWNLVNSSSLVQMNPEDQSALIHFTLTDETDFEQVTRQLAERYQFEITDYQDASVNGLPARRLAIQINNEDQQIRGLTHMIRYDNDTYIFLGLSLQSDFPQYKDSFIRTAEGFREITDTDILNVQPDRLAIKQARQSAPLKELLQNQNVPQEKMEENAILNGLSLNDQVQEGSYYKVITK